MTHLDAITAFDTYRWNTLQNQIANASYPEEWNHWLRVIAYRGYITQRQAKAWRLPETE